MSGGSSAEGGRAAGCRGRTEGSPGRLAHEPPAAARRRRAPFPRAHATPTRRDPKLQSNPAMSLIASDPRYPCSSHACQQAATRQRRQQANDRQVMSCKEATAGGSSLRTCSLDAPREPIRRPTPPRPFSFGNDLHAGNGCMLPFSKEAADGWCHMLPSLAQPARTSAVDVRGWQHVPCCPARLTGFECRS